MNSLKHYIVLILVSLTLIVNAKNSHIAYFTDEADDFLKKNVQNGNVNYKLIFDDSSDLNDLVKLIAGINLEDVGENELLPFYVNAYNILIIDNVVQNYPIETVMEVEDFFEAKYSVGRKMMTLNELESKYIFEVFENEMLHFALVCAAKGCPKLLSRAYNEESLDMYLEENVVDFLNDTNNYNPEGATVQISSIFDWYEGDFGGRNGVIDFINRYAVKKFDESAEITFINYDWNLNENTAVRERK